MAPMTEQELSTFYEMHQEYIKQKKLLDRTKEIFSKCHNCSAKNCVSKKDLALHIKALEKLMELTLSVCDYEKQKLQQYIDTIPNCTMHQLLWFRYINGLSWDQVAASIDAELTGDAAKEIHDRFLRCGKVQVEVAKEEVLV